MRAWYLALACYLFAVGGVAAEQEGSHADEAMFKENALKLEALSASAEDALDQVASLGEFEQKLAPQQSRYQQIYASLKQFSETAPESPYADDALYLMANMQMGQWEARAAILDTLRQRYPAAELEPWSLEDLPLSTYVATNTRLNLTEVADYLYAETLSYAKDYERSSAEFRRLLGQFERMTEADLKDIPQIGMAYITLARNELTQGGTEGARAVYRDGLDRLPPGELRDYCAKELEKLNKGNAE